MTTTTTAVTGERADLLAALAKQRYFLTFPALGLTDEQAAAHPTASELCLGGLIKHVASIEQSWADFVVEGPAAMAGGEENWEAYAAGFQLLPGETLDGVLARYAQVAARTDALVAGIPDLDAAQPLPPAPWFEPGAHWSARRVFLHIVAETAQHSGHADILRESIDGQKSMG